MTNGSDRRQSRRQQLNENSKKLDNVCQSRVDSAVDDVTRQYQMYCLLLLLALGATLVYCRK